MSKPEDLMNVVIVADDLRRKARGLPSTRASLFRNRSWGEPFFNLAGILWGQCMALMPWPLQRRLVQWIFAQLSGGRSEQNPELSKRIHDAIEQARALKANTGQWPALLILASHPDTEGPLQWLRFELLRQGLLIADAVTHAQRPGAIFPKRPKCFLAIDPYALDTESMPVGGFYSGWMHRFYMAWDRQPSSQFWIQKALLLRRTDYANIGWRLLRSLRTETPVIMVLSGGLPFNARLLYGAREFVQRLPIAHWAVSKRQAQVELMKILMTPEGDVCPAEQGIIPAGKKSAIRDAVIQWGLPSEKAEAVLGELEAEFKRPVPSRERLFNVLVRRLAARGKPLLLIGIHHADKAPHVRISSPVAVSEKTSAAALARSIAEKFILLVLLWTVPLGALAADPLEGLWKGNLRRRFVYETRHHQAIYDEELELTLRVGAKDVVGHAAVRLSPPGITRIRIDKSYARWTATFEPSDFGVVVKGSRTPDGQWLHLTFKPTVPVNARYHYRDGSGSTADATLGVSELIPQQIPWTEKTAGRFLRHLTFSSHEGFELPPDLKRFGQTVLGAHFRCEGGFQKVEAAPIQVPKKTMLACLLVYLVAALPVFLKRPSSGGLLAMLGVLSGSLYALEGYGLGGVARMTRMAGFAAAGLATALEASRMKKKRRALPWSSLLLDGVAFFVGVWGMREIMDMAATSATVVGRSWATGLAVVGGILLTGGISWASQRLKAFADVDGRRSVNNIGL